MGLEKKLTLRKLDNIMKREGFQRPKIDKHCKSIFPQENTEFLIMQPGYSEIRLINCSILTKTERNRFLNSPVSVYMENYMAYVKR